MFPFLDMLTHSSEYQDSTAPIKWLQFRSPHLLGVNCSNEGQHGTKHCTPYQGIWGKSLTSYNTEFCKKLVCQRVTKLRSLQTRLHLSQGISISRLRLGYSPFYSPDSAIIKGDSGADRYWSGLLEKGSAFSE